jgi:hypothetical protein
LISDQTKSITASTSTGAMAKAPPKARIGCGPRACASRATPSSSAVPAAQMNVGLFTAAPLSAHHTSVSCGVGIYCDRVEVAYGLERYFVPQGEGRAIESARNEGKVSIVAAVTKQGRAAIKRLLIDGKPVYEEPLF